MRKTLILGAMLALVSCAGAGIKTKERNFKKRVLEVQKETFTRLISEKGSY